MNVLHVSSAFFPGHSHGGTIPALYELCQSLGRLGCDVKVLTTDASGDGRAMEVDCTNEVRLAERVHIRYCKYLMGRSVSPTLLRLLPRYIRWADVVHLSSVYNFPTIPTLLLCRVMGKPLIWSPHGALQRWEGTRRRKLKTIWEWMCRMVGPTPLRLHVTCDEEAVASRARFPSCQTVTIPYCVPIPKARVKTYSEHELRLLYLGRLDPKKGIENLLMACRKLNERRRLSWSLTIAGGGNAEYAQTLQAQIRTITLDPTTARIRMVGEVTGHAKEVLFAEADVLVVPSYTENFGLVVAEALLHEVPVIAGRGTPWKRLEDMSCGLWVENDPDSLVDAIERMTRLPLRDMGRRGRAWIREDFHPDRIGQSTYDWYCGLMVKKAKVTQSFDVCSDRRSR